VFCSGPTVARSVVEGHGSKGLEEVPSVVEGGPWTVRLPTVSFGSNGSVMCLGFPTVSSVLMKVHVFDEGVTSYARSS
jgi:hypothetical protein